MNTEDKYNEALNVIARDMTEVIDTNNERAVEDYMAVTCDTIVSLVEDLEAVESSE